MVACHIFTGNSFELKISISAMEGVSLLRPREGWDSLTMPVMFSCDAYNCPARGDIFELSFSRESDDVDLLGFGFASQLQYQCDTCGFGAVSIRVTLAPEILDYTPVDFGGNVVVKPWAEVIVEKCCSKLKFGKKFEEAVWRVELPTGEVITTPFVFTHTDPGGRFKIMDINPLKSEIVVGGIG